MQKYSHFYIYIAKVQLFIELSPSFIDKFDDWAYFLFIIEFSDVNHNELKAQKLRKQHALKGQKLLAQGIALGIVGVGKAP